MTNQQKWTWGIAVALIVVAVVGWASQMRTKPLGTGEVKIGVLVPLTGNFAVLGESMKNGMELAKEELVEEGLISSIDIIYEDDTCEPQAGLSATQKLLQTDRVKIVGAFFCVNVLEAVMPVTEQNKVIVFNTAANTEGILESEYVFSTNVFIKDDAAKMAEYAYNNLGARTAAISYNASPFGEDYNKFLAQSFEQLGGTVVASNLEDWRAIDFRTQLTKTKAQDPDVVFVIHLANSLGSYLKQARELGIDAPIIGHYEAEDPTVLNSAADAAEGFLISSSEPTQESAVVSSFRAKYQERFSSEPDVLASNAYDALKLQAMAYSKCGEDTNCMKDELHKVTNHQGASGVITINSDGSASKPTIFKQVQNGRFEKVAE